MTIDVEKKLTMSLDDIVAAEKPKRPARTSAAGGGDGGKKTSGPIRKGRGPNMKVAAQPYNKSPANYNNNRGQWQQQQQQQQSSSYGSGGKNWQQGGGYRNQGKSSYYYGGSSNNNNNKSWGGSWGGNNNSSWGNNNNRGGNQSWNQHDNRGSNDYDNNNNSGSYYARNDTGYRQQNNNASAPQQQSRGGAGNSGGGNRRRVVVTNIPYDLTWREIKQAFSSVGTVVHCEVDSSGPKGASANLTFSGTEVDLDSGRLFSATTATTGFSTRQDLTSSLTSSSSCGGGGHERTALLEYGIPPAGSGDLARFCDKLILGLYEQRIFPDLHNIKHRVAEIVLSRSGSHHLLHSGNRKNTWVSSPSLEKGMTRMIQYYAAPSQSNKYAVIADPRVTHTYREASPFPLIVDHAAPDAVALEAIFARITKNGQNCCVLFRETPVISPTFEGSFYFVSPHADDIYERRMWDEFRGYLDKALQDGRRDLYIFPKGRYSCAHALEARKLAFFKGLTMGHLINVVQLAMSKYNLLMFDEDKSIRPPQAAQKVIRSQQRKPSEDSKLYQRDGGPFIANLEELKFCLRVIFQIETSGSISMCRIKNMISQYCHRQLSETKFGESRLSDLMARPELQDTVE
ncbi:hypothetical protein FOZ62_016859, partial [Perkinsus olseni]